MQNVTFYVKNKNSTLKHMSLTPKFDKTNQVKIKQRQLRKNSTNFTIGDP